MKFISLDEAHGRITDLQRERSVLITDPGQDDNPIVFANDAFSRLTGYSREEALGRNCRFLQGPETCAQAIGALREAIARTEAISIDLLNYRKDGTPFWNRLQVRPLVSDSGELESFVSVQNEIPAAEVRREPLFGAHAWGAGPDL